MTSGCRSLRSNYCSDARDEAAADDRARQLSERLLSRRSEREELRRHFDHKYFQGKTAAGDDPAPPDDRATELPAFLLTRKDRGIADDEPLSFQV